jgi:hypothetical protein
VAVDWTDCTGNDALVVIEDIGVSPPFSSGSVSEVDFRGECLIGCEDNLPGTGNVKITWLGLPIADDPFIVCEPGQPDPCPYVHGPMAIEFEADMAGAPGGPYTITYETTNGAGTDLMCVVLSFNL